MAPPQGPVLVVEDDAAVRNSLKFALELEGFDVHVYARAADVLADTRALSQRGCLVVDQWMPDMTGLELVDELRERRIDVAAILITAKPSDRLRLRAAACGVRQVIEKPLQDSALLDCIRDSLRGP